jgi:mannosyl-oligosaccharide alpha-1,3-glucosidase
MSFCGGDIGGFVNHPEDELFLRWFQSAAYQPFFRSHSASDTPRREPYLLKETERNIVKDAIKRRYALLPLWYTMFFEHEREGSPVMRPMLSEFPMDKNAFKLDNQFMLSDKLLVHPVASKGATEVKVYFPSIDGGSESAIWYDCDDYSKIDSVGEKSIKVDMNKIPVYQRGGTIVPKKETVRMSTVAMENDPYTLIVALDKNQHAHGTLYVDDEKSFDYRRGKYLYINFEFHGGKLTNHFVDPANFTTSNKIEKIVVAGLKFVAKSATIEKDGKTSNLEIESASEAFAVIKASDAMLTSEWTITVSGAIQNLLCGGLLAAVLVIHAVKHLMN